MNELQPKDPDVATTYSIDFGDQLVLDAQRRTAYIVGAVVKAPRDTGFYYECTEAGRTARFNPTSWPRAGGESIQDGEVVWTAVRSDNASVPTIDSAVWTVPTGITKDSQSEDDSLAHIVLSGGTADNDYELTCRMTPTSGNPIDVTITVPVRQQ